MPFSFAADPDRSLVKLYDVRRRLGLGTSRITYVIDKQGIIRDVKHNECSMSSHIKNTLKVLDMLEAGPAAG